MRVLRLEFAFKACTPLGSDTPLSSTQYDMIPVDDRIFFFANSRLGMQVLSLQILTSKNQTRPVQRRSPNLVRSDKGNYVGV